MNRSRWPIWVICAFAVVWFGTLGYGLLRLVYHLSHWMRTL